MKLRASLLTASGLLLLAASAAHLLGWDQIGDGLDGVDPGLAEALRIGWIWGSVGFATFGVLVLAAGLGWLRGGRDPRWVAGPVAVALLAFGLWAFLSRDLNPHFLTFVALGALVGTPLLGRVAPPSGSG